MIYWQDELVGDGIWIVSKDSGITAEMITAKPGLVVEKNHPAAVVERVPGTPLPNYIPNQGDTIRQALDNVSGIFDVTQGRKPSGITAGVAIEQLQEAAQTRLRLLVRNLEDSIRNLGEQKLALGAVAIGVLMSAEGFGALLGSLLVAAWVRTRYYTAIYMIGSTLYLSMILAFSLSPWFVVAVLFLFAGGLGIAFFGSMQSTLILFSTIPRMRTRVMGVLVACIGAGPIGVLHVGLLAEWVGAHHAVTIIAVEGLIAIAASALVWPELRRAPVLPSESRD